MICVSAAMEEMHLPQRIGHVDTMPLLPWFINEFQEYSWILWQCSISLKVSTNEIGCLVTNNAFCFKVFEIAKGSTYCNFVVNYLNECPCLVKTERERQIMDDFSTAYSHKLIEIAKYWNSLGLQEFTVSAQTYTQNMKITNLQFVSNLDCFVCWKHGIFLLILTTLFSLASKHDSKSLDGCGTVELNATSSWKEAHRCYSRYKGDLPRWKHLFTIKNKQWVGWFGAHFYKSNIRSTEK